MALSTCVAAGAAVSAVEQARAALPSTKATPTYGYRVVRSFPHDRGAYTQGLVFSDGVFYESTGLYGQSTLRKVRPETGEVLQVRPLDKRYFGEGLALVGQELMQLTWEAETGFVYDLATFAPKRKFHYRGEGWGLAYDGKRLVMSDGSAALRFLDPATFREIGRVTVRDAGGPIDQLNELEIVKGEIFANVYQTNRIARIAPATGQVTGWIDLTGLLSARDAVGAEVLNGIAYDAAGDRLFVTGKLWPKVFEIQPIKK